MGLVGCEVGAGGGTGLGAIGGASRSTSSISGARGEAGWGAVGRGAAEPAGGELGGTVAGRGAGTEDGAAVGPFAERIPNRASRSATCWRSLPTSTSETVAFRWSSTTRAFSSARSSG